VKLLFRGEQMPLMLGKKTVDIFCSDVLAAAIDVVHVEVVYAVPEFAHRILCKTFAAACPGRTKTTGAWHHFPSG
jgi:hypothetical protein